VKSAEIRVKLGYSTAFPLFMESTVKHLTMQELEAALDHLLRMIVDVRAKIAAAGPKLARHREVVAHERELVFGPGGDAKKQVTKRIALLGAALFLVALLLAAIASKLGP
jgi:hypothetical protein